MKSTRYSRPRGHLGSGLTFAVPFGLLGLISATALGHPVVGITLFSTSILNRIIQSLAIGWSVTRDRSEEHTSELQSQFHLVCRLLLEKKKNINKTINNQ